MTKVFPAWSMRTATRRGDPATGQMIEEDARHSLELEEDAQDYIHETLNERFGVNAFYLMHLTREPAWAAVLFTGVIKNSDEILKARGELREEIKFGPYGEVQPGMSNPPIGAMIVKSKSVLHAASSRHDALHSPSFDCRCVLMYRAA